MRVAFFSPSANKKNGWGAITSELCDAYFNFYKNKVDFDLYLPKTEKGKEYIGNLDFVGNINFTLPEFAWSFRNPKRLWKYLSNKALIRKPDLIHVLDFPYAFSAMVNSKNKIPYIITLCGTFYKPLFSFPDNFLFNRTYKKASNVNAISDFTLSTAIKECKIDENKTDVVHAGVNYARFEKKVDVTDLRKKYGEDKKIIIGVGALKARKGFDVVIKSMRKVKEMVPNAIYILIGSGSNKKSLKDLVKKLNLEETVLFAGRISDEELPAYFHMCDVYCHTPRYTDGAFEGFGIVYLEAGAASKPVVGSRSGGVPDAILEGKTGLLVPENDPEATADALIKLLKDVDLAKKMGEFGRKYAEQHKWKNIAGEYFGLYKDLC